MAAHDPDRLLVRLDCAASLASRGPQPTAWAACAEELWAARSLPGAPPTPSDFALVAAIQAVQEEIVLRHREAHPTLLSRLLGDAGQRAGRVDMALGLASFGAAWRLRTFGVADSDRAGALLVLGALLDNPAIGAMRPLFDGPELAGPAGTLLRALEEGVAAQPPVPPFTESLPRLLRAPAEACPGSLAGQVAWIRQNWGSWLPERLLGGLLRAGDLRAEEQGARGGGPGPAPILELGPPPDEDRFSRDEAWMPQVVLLAKQCHVWLDQLSRRYGRLVRRLDQIPDEELDRIAACGFTSLWLIGLWERSPASRAIKQRRGNPEAEASAYALRGYQIAEGLGGEAACDDLRRRAASRGLRLAADMVPNHCGLDSGWMVEHPEWFVSTPRPPYPSYTFTGPDLSGDPRVEVRLEDGYWTERDAAVVFERRDPETGEVRYVYHGNDGTQMPWNDTAQLDFLNPELREAVIQQILEVARRFPVIRFDAAMTLAKQHVQRLWYPPPGQGGAVPSRSAHALPQGDFDAAMPREFWREVVERVQREVPDTLLLAEAFWMMEGYFVRSLGMHRVYNSAFMHMLRDEDNAGYRRAMRNVLETSPAVLERFVNFMNNPDEESAREQFGTGDKYFGVCTLLATLPGLPMFGHGQVEGFAEKYGMEYRRAYWDEKEDAGLIAWHERVIFPLLRDRRRFSSVEHFALYDFVGEDGGVIEDVFAYSNRGPDGERSLIVYNNRMEHSRGALRRSVPRNVGEAAAPELLSQDFSDALGLSAEEGGWYGLFDLRLERWTLRSAHDLAERGLTLDLPGYGCRVFTELRELRDDDGTWAALGAHLGGGGVPDLEEARAAMLDRWTAGDLGVDADGAALITVSHQLTS